MGRIKLNIERGRETSCGCKTEEFGSANESVVILVQFLMRTIPFGIKNTVACSVQLYFLNLNFSPKSSEIIIPR